MRSFAIVARGDTQHGKAGQTAHTIHGLLREHGAQSQLYVTAVGGSLNRLVKLALQEHSSADGTVLCIVICGGDGSIQEAINALLSEAAPNVLVGLAPTGTCNDFAFALGIKPAPRDIVNVLLQGEIRPVDLGRAGSTYFCTIATLGFESAVNRFLRDRMIRSPPRWLFVATATARLAIHASLQVKLTIDGKSMEVDTLNLLVANTSCYGGHIRIAPSANPHDGLFDIIMFQPMSRLRRFLLLGQVLAGRHVHRPGVTCRRAACITIETARPQEVWADGEPVGPTPIDFEIVPRAIRVLVAANSS